MIMCFRIRPGPVSTRGGVDVPWNVTGNRYRPAVVRTSTRGGTVSPWIIVIGLFAGVLSGMFGIGGGIVIVPALILLARFQPQQATGTSLGALLLPVGLLGAMQYWKRGDVDFRASLILAAGLFLGAFAGAKLGLSMSPLVLRRSFAVFLVLVAGQLWFRR
jgi:uncharacterized membrane protein YfcA